MKTAKVAIAGKDYTIKELPIRKSVAWRKQVADKFSELTDALTNAGNADTKDVMNVVGIVKGFAAKLFGSVEVIADLLFAYSPELEADREKIESDGYESEIVDAFVEVVLLAFPFFGGKLRGLLTEIGSQKQ